MTATDEGVLDILTGANPHPRSHIAEVSEDPRAQAMLAAILAEPAPARPVHRLGGGHARIGRRVLMPVLSLLVVAAVVAVVLHVGAARRSTTTAPNAAMAHEIVLQLRTTPEVPRITASAITQEIQILRARLRSVPGAAGARVTRDGNQIVVHSRKLAGSPIARGMLTMDPQLALSDWEANVIARDGRTVASLLLGGNRAAQLISQGHTGLAGGSAAGALTLYAAVRLASHQPTRADATTQTRRGPESFAFAPAGSGDCRISRTPCWASGPRPTAAAASDAARRAGIAHPIVLTVPQGTIIVRASEPGAALRPDYRAPAARYFVMRDDAVITGLDLHRVTTVTTPTGQPAVSAALSTAGTRAFQALSATIAHRGISLDFGARPSYQHFAVIINGALATVPIIDYHQYPDGVIGSTDIQIDAGLPRAQATALANTLRLRTLPLRTVIVRGG